MIQKSGNSNPEINFNNINHPVEALFVPMVDFNASRIGNQDLQEIEGRVKIGADSFEFSFKPDHRIELKHRKKSSSIQGRPVRAGSSEEFPLGGAKLRGNFGASPVSLDYKPGMGGYQITGRAGEIEINQQFDDKTLKSYGTIGGMDYKEQVSVAPDRQSLISTGSLGDLEIEKTITQQGNQRIIKGHIGDLEIEECIIFRTVSEKKSAPGPEQMREKINQLRKQADLPPVPPQP